MRKSDVEVAIVVAIFITLIIPLFVYLYKHLKSKTLFYSKYYKDILDLKHHLRNVEREINSYKQIRETGSMSESEEEEWGILARKHKEINQMIVSLTNTKDDTDIEWIDNPIDEYVVEKIEKLSKVKEKKREKEKKSMLSGETMKEYNKRLRAQFPMYALFRTYILSSITFIMISTLLAITEVITWDDNGAFIVPVLIVISPIITIVLYLKSIK